MKRKLKIAHGVAIALYAGGLFLLYAGVGTLDTCPPEKENIILIAMAAGTLLGAAGLALDYFVRDVKLLVAYAQYLEKKTRTETDTRRESTGPKALI